MLPSVLALADFLKPEKILDKGGLALNGHFHQCIEGFERSVAQPSGDLARHAAYGGERRVQVQIGGVHATHTVRAGRVAAVVRTSPAVAGVRAIVQVGAVCAGGS